MKMGRSENKGEDTETGGGDRLKEPQYSGKENVKRKQTYKTMQ